MLSVSTEPSTFSIDCKQESRIIKMLFTLSMWPILFDDIPGAFETSYQTGPLDLREDSFYESRKDAIEVHLTEIQAGKAPNFIQATDDAERPSKTFAVGVNWEYPCQDLMEIAEVSR